MGVTHDSTMDGKGQRKCTTNLGTQRYIVLGAAEIGIGKKKLMDISKDCWSPGIEAAIQAWKVSCKKLREARSGNVGDKSLLRQWEEYKSTRRHAKRM